MEVSEPESPEGEEGNQPPDVDIGPSVLSNLLRRSPPQSFQPDAPISTDTRKEDTKGSHQDHAAQIADQAPPAEGDPDQSVSERTPLLGHVSDDSGDIGDVEGQKSTQQKKWFSGIVESGKSIENHVAHAVSVAVNPRRWDRRALLHSVIIEPASCLPAVAVGLLLNILDALSYGEISLQPFSKEFAG